MGIFSFLTGNKQAMPPSPASTSRTVIEEIEHEIAMTEGELSEAEDRLSVAVDPEIKSSLELLVVRKTQAIADLKEKLAFARTTTPQ